jgi:quinol monooxygenase YgiN
MSKIWVKGHARAKDGDTARFEKWAAELVDKIRSSDPDTLAFGVYPTGSNDEYVFLELYADSSAAMGHFANVGPLLGRMGDVADPTGAPLEVYGHISDELREAYAAWGPVVLAPASAC